MSQSTTEVGQLEQILRYLTECRSITGCSEPVALKDHCREIMMLMRDCKVLLEGERERWTDRPDDEEEINRRAEYRFLIGRLIKYVGA